MPAWMRALGMASMLCVPLAQGVCQDDPDGQVAEYARLVASDPSSSLAHYRLGEAYLRADNLQSAATEFREALNRDLDPEWTRAWSHIQLGRIFDVSGQHERAMNEYRQAQQTGDNTNGGLDEVNNYLNHAEHAIYVGPSPTPLLTIQPVQKTDPEYTPEARIAELEGTVVLRGVIDEEGLAQDLQVAEPLGLGLDQKAIEAVKQWTFQPQLSRPQRPRIPAQIDVDFRLPSHQSRWHLIQVQFDTPAGASRPVFVNALYPIGAGLGPEAMQEGRLVAAMGRLATARLTFEIDQNGVPINLQAQQASDPVWGPEATAVVGEWRFTPGTKYGIPVPVRCTVDLVWGQRELTGDLERQLRDVLAAR
jgi:TonB family protein